MTQIAGRSFLIGAIALCAGLAGGTMLTSVANSYGSDPTYHQLSVFAEALHTIRATHVQPPSTEALIDAAIRGMTTDLDEYSDYLNAEELVLFEEETEGEYVGAGMEIDRHPEGILVIGVFKGAPADKAGLKPGDVLTVINGKNTQPLSVDDVAAMTRGHVGETVAITYLRDGETHTLTLVKGVVHILAVEAALLPGGIGHIQLHFFSHDVKAKVSRELQTLTQQHKAPLAGVILDLRDNPGGFLTSAIEISNLFLSHGRITAIAGVEGEIDESWNAHKKSTIYDGPLSVLINENSASASEIVAAALKENRRADVYGETTFGKGSVQSLLPLSNGGAMKLTTSRYLTPSGQCIHGVGVAPNFRLDVPLPERMEHNDHRLDCEASPAAEPPQRLAVPDNVGDDPLLDLVHARMLTPVTVGRTQP